MSVDVQVPRLAESISDAVLVEWLRADGATVKADEPIATLETDKAAVEIAATEPGVLRHARAVGETVLVGDVIARIDAGGADGSKPAPVAGASAAAKPPAPARMPVGASASALSLPSPPAAVPAAAVSPPVAGAANAAASAAGPPPNGGVTTPDAPLSPAVRRLVEEHHLEPATIPASGRGGRLLKEDVLRHLESASAPGAVSAPSTPTPPGIPAPAIAQASAPDPAAAVRPPAAAPSADERVVPMSRLRQRIAERLVQAQHTAAILTTFNEIDMTAVLELRARHKDAFERRHGVKLGFMGLFTRACVHALEDVPELNAEIRGTDILYRRRVHMGVAVGTPRGLVVPVVRDAHALTLDGIEREIGRLAVRAKDGTLSLDELTGGTFTISNGGVYGSLLSTPILNPPQSGILGMHKIERRPIALDTQVVIRPMMYVALSYDHRIVDGEQAVTFLVRVKERLEDPERMLLNL